MFSSSLRFLFLSSACALACSEAFSGAESAADGSVDATAGQASDAAATETDSSSGGSRADGASGAGGVPASGGATEAGVEPPICTPGERICEEDTARTCNESGTAFDASAVDCSALGARCVKGLCENGLVAYWPFDEEEGNVTVDASGNGNDGTLINGDWAARNGGGALELGSSGAYIDVGDTLNNLTVPFSVAAWVFVETPDSGQVLFASEATPVYSGFWIERWPDRWEISYGDGRDINPNARRTMSSNGPLPSGVWVHIAAVVAGPTNMRLYMDGTEVPGTLSGAGLDMVHGDAPFLIGTRDFGGISWDGQIDELRVYQRALSASEVATLAEL